MKIKKMLLSLIALFMLIVFLSPTTAEAVTGLQAWCLNQEQIWDNASSMCIVNNAAIVEPTEILLIAMGESIHNTSTGYITMDGALDNDGSINNDGYIYNIGLLTNNIPGVIINNGTIYNHNDNTTNNDGTIDNSGTINNDATMENRGYFYNNGDINSSGVFENNQGTLVNNGLINNLGVFDNNGTINNLDSIFNFCPAIFTGSPPLINPVIYIPCYSESIYLPIVIK